MSGSLISSENPDPGGDVRVDLVYKTIILHKSEVSRMLSLWSLCRAVYFLFARAFLGWQILDAVATLFADKVYEIFSVFNSKIRVSLPFMMETNIITLFTHQKYLQAILWAW